MKTQEQAILDALLGGVVVTGSNAYAITKKECACGTLNLHKVLALIRKKATLLMSVGIATRKPKQTLKNLQ